MPIPIWMPGTGCAGYGVGAAAIPGGEVVCGFELAVFSERAVVCAFRDFGLGVFSGRGFGCLGVGVLALTTALEFSLRYLRNIARFGSSAAAMRRSRRPASIWPCLMRHKPRPSHPSPKAESRAIAVSKASLASFRLFRAQKSAQCMRGGLRGENSGLCSASLRQRPAELNCDSATRVQVKPLLASSWPRAAPLAEPQQDRFRCQYTAIQSVVVCGCTEVDFSFNVTAAIKVESAWRPGAFSSTCLNRSSAFWTCPATRNKPARYTFSPDEAGTRLRGYSPSARRPSPWP